MTKTINETYEEIIACLDDEEDGSGYLWDALQQPEHRKNLTDAFQVLKEHQADTITIPEGYALVPIEPTEEMILAGIIYRMDDADQSCAPIYKAMITNAMKEGAVDFSVKDTAEKHGFEPRTKEEKRISFERNK